MPSLLLRETETTFTSLASLLADVPAYSPNRCLHRGCLGHRHKRNALKEVSSVTSLSLNRHLRSMPPVGQDVFFHEMGKICGDVVHLNVLGQSLIILDSAQVAIFDLPDKRSNKYSHTNDFHPIFELCFLYTVNLNCYPSFIFILPRNDLR